MKRRWRIVAIRGGERSTISTYYLARNARLACAALTRLRNGTTYVVESTKETP